MTYPGSQRQPGPAQLKTSAEAGATRHSSKPSPIPIKNNTRAWFVGRAGPLIPTMPRSTGSPNGLTSLQKNTLRGPASLNRPRTPEIHPNSRLRRMIALKATMNQKSFGVQILKSGPQMLTSDTSANRIFGIQIAVLRGFEQLTLISGSICR